LHGVPGMQGLQGMQLQGLPGIQTLPQPSLATFGQQTALSSPAVGGFGSIPTVAGAAAGIEATGKVKVWYEDKGFGFIAPDDSRFGNTDIFVHRSKLHDGQSLLVGAPVLFKAEWITAKGKYAIAELSGASEGPAGGLAPLVGAAVAVPGSGRSMPSDKLFVAGLPLQANEDYVKSIFGAHGIVQDCKVLPENGRPNKAALVRMATVDQASTVIQNMNGSTVQGTGQQLVVRFADNPSTGRAAPVMSVQTSAFSISGLGTGQLPTSLGQASYGKLPAEGQHVPAAFSPYGSAAATGPSLATQAS
jgi:cold shock CspA family protein